MALLTITETIPLETDADGVMRVNKTRVTLDTIIQAFSDGATAEEIAQQYPSVSLASIYYVIGYYLSCFDEVEAYLQQRRQLAERTRQRNEARLKPAGIRARLLARKRSGQA